MNETNYDNGTEYPTDSLAINLRSRIQVDSSAKDSRDEGAAKTTVEFQLQRETVM